MATLMLIHGMWGSGPRWGAFAKALEKAGHTVLTPTLRHHDGKPSDPPNPALGKLSLLDYADDLEAEIAKLEDKPVLIGHSMGGLLAQILAARGLAKAAIFLTPAPPAGWPATLIILMPSVLRTFFWTILTRCMFVFRPHRPSYDTAVYSCFHMLDEKGRRAEYDAFVHESGRAVFEIAYWWLDLKRAARVDPEQVTCPTLTVAGGLDRITPAATVRATAKRYAKRGGDFTELPGNAHWVLGEKNWPEVARLCLDWIQDKAPDPKPAKKAPAKRAATPAAKKRAAAKSG